MIGKLKGIIDTIDINSVILDVGGVGYEVFCSANTMSALPGKGEAATLFIETHVREDHINLYGFSDISEKNAYKIITKVSGVGTKVALAILSVLNHAQLSTAIAAQDQSAFKVVSGVGPKLAARIITELQDKFALNAINEQLSAATLNNTGAANSNISDAISALVNLGYSRTDAYNAVNKISAQNDNIQIDDLIRQGLRELGVK